MGVIAGDDKTKAMREEGATQKFTWPDALEQAVRSFTYKDWIIELGHKVRDDNESGFSEGLTLSIVVRSLMNTYHPEDPRPTIFYFPVPAYTLCQEDWERWLFDQCMLVEQHEGQEQAIFVSSEGKQYRPFAPTHGPGRWPFYIRSYESDEARRTLPDGTVKED